jgi:hypothetical protein
MRRLALTLILLFADACRSVRVWRAAGRSRIRQAVLCRARSPGWGAEEGNNHFNSASQHRRRPSRSRRRLYRQHRSLADPTAR